ncbi:cell wall inhibition responsive protein CwrA [Staphylococcus aureus]|nr:cell wall inhibition responsive protein CwrA [Staphylococcus aureus]
MRILITGTVAILIILGLVKTIQDYEMTNDTSRQLSDNKDDDKVIHLKNFKNLHAKEFNPSDFF